jgi:16S rRNA (cytidine1402-2'-O)-methyltransferase
LASDRFLFIGFLPTKAQALRSEVASWRGGRASVVFYESPRRLRSTLKVIAEVYPGARLAIGRELTKLHEEIVVSSIEDAMAWADAHESMKGEAVVMVEVPVDSGTPLADVEVKLRLEAQEMFAEGRSLRDVLLVLKDRGLPRQQLYQMLLEVKDDEDYR